MHADSHSCLRSSDSIVRGWGCLSYWSLHLLRNLHVRVRERLRDLLHLLKRLLQLVGPDPHCRGNRHSIFQHVMDDALEADLWSGHDPGGEQVVEPFMITGRPLCQGSGQLHLPASHHCRILRGGGRLRRRGPDVLRPRVLLHVEVVRSVLVPCLDGGKDPLLGAGAEVLHLLAGAVGPVLLCSGGLIKRRRLLGFAEQWPSFCLLCSGPGLAIAPDEAAAALLEPRGEDASVQFHGEGSPAGRLNDRHAPLVPVEPGALDDMPLRAGRPGTLKEALQVGPATILPVVHDRLWSVEAGIVPAQLLECPDLSVVWINTRLLLQFSQGGGALLILRIRRGLSSRARHLL
mmetsp:Transcript_34091/g.98110  ORF Transcript_34091/g.98110 Transcript_34091/m.98110 type:complete len:347 (-) Transcript_34091:101-1141(-)